MTHIRHRLLSQTLVTDIQSCHRLESHSLVLYTPVLLGVLAFLHLQDSHGSFDPIFSAPTDPTDRLVTSSPSGSHEINPGAERQALRVIALHLDGARHGKPPPKSDEGRREAPKGAPRSNPRERHRQGSSEI